MALLNLQKPKNAEGGEKQEVPDELPPLPGKDQKPAATIAAPAEQKPALDTKPAEAPKKEEPKLAPDELPPVSKVQHAAEAKPSQTATQAAKPQPRPEAAPEAAIDEKLYFSELIARMHDEDKKLEAEQEILSRSTAEILSNLGTQFSQQKQDDEVKAFENQIEERMRPLQKLEQEWRSLKLEMENRTELLKEKEKKIKEELDGIKEILQEKNKHTAERKNKSRK